MSFQFISADEARRTADTAEINQQRLDFLAKEIMSAAAAGNYFLDTSYIESKSSYALFWRRATTHNTRLLQVLEDQGFHVSHESSTGVRISWSEE